MLTDTSADLAFTLMLMTGRKVLEAGQYLRAGKWKGWSPMQFLGTDISGATLGIIGMGCIGKAMTKRARGFDMEVV